MLLCTVDAMASKVVEVDISTILKTKPKLNEMNSEISNSYLIVFLINLILKNIFGDQNLVYLNHFLIERRKTHLKCIQLSKKMCVCSKLEL